MDLISTDIKGLVVSIKSEILLAAVCLILAPIALAQELVDKTEQSGQSLIAFIGVQVIPMDRERVLENQTVIVRDGVIHSVGDRGQIKIPESAQIIEGNRRYLLPGLADMHVHLNFDSDALLYLANGVTLVRNMAAKGEETIQLRTRLNTGELLGPNMVASGRMVDGSPAYWGPGSSDEVTTAEQAIQVVLKQKAAGFDFIKTYSLLSPETFDAIVETAKTHNMVVAGHVPHAVPLDHAIQSGLTTIEHLTGFMEFISYAGDKFPSFEIMVSRMLEGKEFVTEEELQFDAGKLQSIAELAAANGSYNVPTLCRMNITVPRRSELDALLARPEVAYVNPTYRAMWEPTVKYGDGYSQAEWAIREKFNRVNLAYVSALHKAGAPLLVGTDAPNPLVIPGYSVHDELSLFVDAGLTTYEAIEAATSNPARMLNAIGKFGIVAEGARADLVLVKSNPLQNVTNLRSPDGVMVRGRWLSRQELLARLEKLANSFE